MAERFDISTLRWLKGEIDETLEQARIAITTYIEEGQDENQIGFCVSFLHQVRGSLQLVELHGATQLASEMEAVASALAQKRIAEVETAAEVLMRAFLQLPDYLEALHDGLPDNPVILLPIINELRGVRGESQLSAAAFFEPDLRTEPPAATALIEDLRPVATKARAFFQSHLVKLLQGKDLDAGFKAVGSVFEKLSTVTADRDLRRWLWVTAGLVEGLRERGIEYGKEPKQLLARAEQVLKQLATGGSAAVSPELIASSTRSALFHVAGATSRGQRIGEIRAAFGLDSLLPSSEQVEEARGRLGGFNTALKRTVAADLVEELTRAKETLDIVSRRRENAGEDLTKLVSALSTIASTVEVLQQHVLAAALNSQVETIRRLLSSASVVDEQELMGIAEVILAVESALADWGSSAPGDGVGGGVEQDPAEAEHRRVVRQVMREAKTDLINIKEGINRYLAAPDDKTPLRELSVPMQRLIGSMGVVGYERVSLILRASSLFVRERMLDAAGVPPDDQLDLLADALTSIEYYFEAFVESRVHPESALEVAERSAAALGYPVDTLSALTPEAEPDEVTEPTREAQAPSMAEAAPEPAAALNQPTSPPGSAPRPAPALPPEQDEEIIEIFVEEANEQFAAIDELLPRWRSVPGDTDTLKDLRRCFHTLKGSGRLVGARDLGEFSWAFESLLNRIIDGSIVAGNTHFELIDRARPLLHELLALFRAGGSPDEHVLAIQDLAQTLSRPDAPQDITIPERPLPAATEAPGESVEADVPQPVVVVPEPSVEEAAMLAPPEGEPVAAAPQPAMDPVLLEIYSNECFGHLQTVVAFVERCGEQGGRCRVDNELVRALHTLRGASRTAGVPSVAALSGTLEDYARLLQTEGIPLPATALELLSDMAAAVRGVIDGLADPSAPIPELQALTERAEGLVHEAIHQPAADATGTNGGATGEAASAPTPLPADAREIPLPSDLLAEPEPEFTGEAIDALEVELPHVEASLGDTGVAASTDEVSELADLEQLLAEGDLELIEVGELPDVSISATKFAEELPPLELLGERELPEISEVSFDAEPEALEGAALLQLGDVDSFPAVEKDEVVASIDVAADGSGVGLLLEDLDGETVGFDASFLEPAESSDQHPGLSDVATLPAEQPQASGEEPFHSAIEISGDTLESLVTSSLSDEPAPSADPISLEMFDEDDELAALEALLADEPYGDESIGLGTEAAAPEQLEPASAVEAEVQSPDLVAEQPNEALPPLLQTPVVPDLAEEYDQDLLEIFLEEAGEILDETEGQLQQWRSQPGDRAVIESLQRLLHTLKGGARMAGIGGIADLSHEVETLLTRVVEGLTPASHEMVALLERTSDRLVQMVEALKERQQLPGGEDLMGQLRAMAYGHGPEAIAAESLAPPTIDAPPVAQEIALAAVPSESTEAPQLPTELYDQDLLEIFLEEGTEILDSAEIQLQSWKQHPDNRAVIDELQRLLHTLKGGARMAGITRMGDLSHEVESLLTRVVDGHIAVSQTVIGLLHVTVDRLVEMLDQLKRRASLSDPAALIENVRAVAAGGAEFIFPEEESSSAPVAQDAPQASVEPPVAEPATPLAPAVTPTEAPGTELHAAEPERRQASRVRQEMVRVRADLFDGLVNLAGEASIYRSRIGQQIGEFRGNFDELDETVERLRDQLRQLEIESEAQIQSRYEEAVAQDQHFDPLEFDRFTRMQQLSRSISESLNDLVSLRAMLQGLVREAETLLLQQSRVNTELQEGLMQARMVPLVEHAPRLRRVVRQACADLGRQAELHFSNGEVELDRSVLERMLAPLEHLLRNAIAHGIEEPEARIAAGKRPDGEVVIALAREGSEIVIRVTDNGRGIDLGSVRRKAIERGLLSAQTDLSDRDVMQFILESGFSTAEVLTQVAGRGVGMDVVNSEVKQLGGSLEIDSTRGQGTSFTIRLPLTLAVSRALLVQSSDEIFAVPLLSIQGIVRVTQEELAVFRQQQPPTFQWLEQDYHLLPLAQLVGSTPLPPADGAKRPLVLAQTGDNRVALEVDAIIGSREVVVKSLGPQLAALHGLSGATILGDGTVAMILDLPNLIRQGLARPHLMQAALEQEKASAIPTVMVVDDSITVRRVTQRLLERNHLQSLTAKDGVEALSVLEEHLPDVILLDIEMPRMDGYELATHIRNNERLRHIPLIMITSRSGDKHRQRAMDIGVDRYLGKPYQEADLLENIRALLGTRHEAARPAATA